MTTRPAHVIGIIAIVVGILFIVAGGVTWGLITSNLSEQKIVVAGDSPVLAGDTVNGPFSAFAQAQIINTHAEHASGGKTYAERSATRSRRPSRQETPPRPSSCRLSGPR